MENGWFDHQEINRVFYDPDEVDVESMVKWLKKAGTYRKTLRDMRTDKGEYDE